MQPPKPEIAINGVVVIPTETTGEQSVEQVNQCVDEMVQVSLALANTVNSLATNFHSAYDSHTDAIRSVTDQMQRRVEGLSARNRELSDTRYTMANELEGLRD